MDDINNDPLLGEVIMGKYLIIRKLGEGSFGKIYKGEYDNKNYALKIEKKRNGYCLLKPESETLKVIQQNFPKLYSPFSTVETG